MIPPSGYLRRVILTFVLVSLPLALGMLLTYDVLKVNWTSTMEDQPAVEYQAGPRKSAPSESVRFDGPSLAKDGQLPVNVVPADAVSLQRGQLLFERNCALCHGPAGQGDGPISQYFKADARKPANLTDPRIAQQADGTLYITIAQGFGQMPPLGENLDVRERWDVVNYVRSLSKK
jgi:mono/diheme cytochrome c family protein